MISLTADQAEVLADVLYVDSPSDSMVETLARHLRASVASLTELNAQRAAAFQQARAAE